MNATEYEARIRALVKNNRGLWGQMDRAKVASYRYLAKFAKGGYENPGIHTLAAIEQFIEEQKAA